MIKIINVIFVISLIVLFFFISFLDSNLSIKKKKVILFFFTLIFTVFLGCRSIGLDLEPYRMIFHNHRIMTLSEIFSGGIFSNRMEPFFIILISILKMYGLGFNWFLLISGGVPILIIYGVIRKKENKYMLVTFLFFLLLHFLKGPVDIIRHFFAASIYLSAIYSLSEKEKMKFWIKTTGSTFVHYSNIVIIFIRPLLNLRWDRTKYVLSVLVVCILSFFANVLIPNLTKFNFINSSNTIIWKISYYLTHYNIEGYQYIGILHKILLSIMSYFPFVFNIAFIFLGLNRITILEKDRFYKMLLDSQIVGSLISIFFIMLNATTLGMRLNFLLSIGNFMLAKEIIFNCYKDKQLFLFSFTLLSLVFYNFIIVLYYAGIHDPMSPFFLF